jgi:hypothetical protein
MDYKAIVEGKTYTRTSNREYNYFWIADIKNKKTGNIKKNYEKGFSAKFPTIKNGLSFCHKKSNEVYHNVRIVKTTTN